MFLPNSAANLRWTRRQLVPFNIMDLWIGMVRSLHVRDPAGWSNCVCMTQGGENSSLSAVQHKYTRTTRQD